MTTALLALSVLMAFLLIGAWSGFLKVNWRMFAVRFSVLCCFGFALLFMGGCSATWIGALQGMIPAIGGIVTALVSFVSSLEGKTVPPAFSAAVQKWAANVTDLLSQLSTLVAAAGSGTGTIITQIQSVMSQLSTSLNSILQDSGVTDASTLAKIEEFVQLAIAAVNAVLALFPLALARIKSAGGNLAKLEAVDADAKDVINAAHKTLKSTYHAVVTQETTSLVVNQALGAMPQQIS